MPLGEVETPDLAPKMRYRLGDVEINDPNTYYHLDNGDYTGFNKNGAYFKDGKLYPGKGN
jgi:hypothetical protein